MSGRLQGTSKNPNPVAMLSCSKNFNAYISNICGALKFLSRLAWLITSHQVVVNQRLMSPYFGDLAEWLCKAFDNLVEWLVVPSGF